MKKVHDKKGAHIHGLPMSRTNCVKVSLYFFLFLCVIISVSCKKKESTVEPQTILSRWATSIEKLDYRTYKSCEAFPKENSVFKEMYSAYYFRDIMVTKMEPLDQEDKKIDPGGNTYISRTIHFEGAQINRKTNEPEFLIRGDFIFVNYMDGDKKDKGWLMSHRTFYRIRK